MTREDLEKCFSYHAAGAALDIMSKSKNDVVNAFEAGAEWAQGFMIERACEWLKSNLGTPKEVHPVLVNHLIYNFRKAMAE